MVDDAVAVRAQAVELLRQGELYALAGKAQRARDLLEQVWLAAAESAPDVANDAAWYVAWLLVQSGDCRDAAKWLERVVAPARSTSLWPVAHLAMLQLCRSAAAGQSAAQPGPYAPAAGQPPSLTITSLGQFQVRLSGQPLPACRSQKAVSIFRYLLTRASRSAEREELMELYWPAASPQDAANSLHAAISALRRYLSPAGAGGLLFDGGRYMLSAVLQIEDDRERFLRQVELAGQRWREGDLPGAHEHYADAVACYGGDYYVDSRDPTWSLAEREQLASIFHTALERIAHIAASQGRYERAVECYQAVLQRDSYREDLHYQLMRCYQQLGRRGDALRQYERCSSVLARELGLEPMPELQALYLRIAGGGDEPPADDLVRAPASAAAQGDGHPGAPHGPT